jgi:hypothetical protein
MDSLRQRHIAATDRIPGVVREAPLKLAGAAIAFLLVAQAASLGADASPYAAFEKTLTAPAEAPFPTIAPFRATYRFGWERVGAGGATVEVTRGADPNRDRNRDRLRVVAKGGPNSLIRKLWNYQALYTGEAGADGRIPSWFRIDEELSEGDLLSEAVFGDDSVLACHRFIWEPKPWTLTRLPGVRDLFAAMLFVRSQQLRNGEQLRLTVFPDQNPYLVDLTVAGRDTLTILGKKTPAIRFTIRIRTIETRGPNAGRLAPHGKFRSGRVWMSDDARRLPLRAEVDVFIGSVFAELSTLTPAL